MCWKILPADKHTDYQSILKEIWYQRIIGYGYVAILDKEFHPPLHAQSLKVWGSNFKLSPPPRAVQNLNGLEGIEKGSMFIWRLGISRGHSHKLFKRRVRLDVGKYCFSSRVCDELMCAFNTIYEFIVEKKNSDCKLPSFLHK